MKSVTINIKNSCLELRPGYLGDEHLALLLQQGDMDTQTIYLEKMEGIMVMEYIKNYFKL